MKKQLLIGGKRIFLAGLPLLMMLPVMAQKELPTVTQDQVNKINELVKPLKDQLTRQLNEDKTGTYKAYMEDIKKLNVTTDAKERSSSTSKIMDKYSAFFKTIWEAAKVDERSYQAKIKNVFPEIIGSQIQFQSYLNFSVIYSAASGTIARTPEPLAPNKCMDVCSIAAGEITGTSGLISGGGGMYGNCFLRTSAWGAVVAKSELYGYLRNNITIPGTFPNDNRKLHVTKNYQLRQEATSFAGLGFGYAETWARTYQSSEYMLVMSPVIFGASKLNFKTMNEDYVLQKKDVALSVFKTYAGTFAFGFSGNWCYSDCSSIKWTICEQ